MNKLTTKAIALTLILSSLPMVARKQGQTAQVNANRTEASVSQEEPSIWQRFSLSSPTVKATTLLGTAYTLWQVSKIAAPLVKAGTGVAFKIAPIVLAIGATALGISSWAREKDDFSNVGNAVKGMFGGGLRGLWNWGQGILFGQNDDQHDALGFPKTSVRNAQQEEEEE